MTVFSTGLDANIGKVDEEEVCEGIDYLGGIWCRVVVLPELSVGSIKKTGGDLQTSSHQLMVEVTGSQNPPLESAYATEGSQEGILKA